MSHESLTLRDVVLGRVLRVVVESPAGFLPDDSMVFRRLKSGTSTTTTTASGVCGLGVGSGSSGLGPGWYVGSVTRTGGARGHSRRSGI
jgi:hypothetical protein